MKIAAVTDIHGHLPALEAVLEDVEHANVDMLVNLGDIISGPLWPVETAQLLMPMDLPTISGNHERQLLTQTPEEMDAADSYAYDTIEQNHRDWLASLPETLQLTENVFLCHGTPSSDLIYLLEDFGTEGVIAADPTTVLQRLGDRTEPVVLCGHTHVQRSTVLENGQLIVNPGSVGLPAFEDLLPVRHKVEAGTPHARYAIVSNEDGNWAADLRAVEYDWERAAQRAEENNNSDWARALRTGFA